MLNLMEIFISPVLDRKYIFWTNLVLNIKIVYFLPWRVTYTQQDGFLKSLFTVLNIYKMSLILVLHYKLQEKFKTIHSIN